MLIHEGGQKPSRADRHLNQRWGVVVPLSLNINDMTAETCRVGTYGE